MEQRGRSVQKEIMVKKVELVQKVELVYKDLKVNKVAAALKDHKVVVEQKAQLENRD